jgi:Spy/CpxP family protein refolding chaperone
MIIVLTAAGVLAPLALASAQVRAGRFGASPGRPGARVERLQQARERARRMAAHLDLTEAQRKAMAGIMRSCAEKARGVARDGTLRPADRLRRMREIRAERRSSIEKLLTPEQRDKLRSRAPRQEPGERRSAPKRGPHDAAA